MPRTTVPAVPSIGVIRDAQQLLRGYLEPTRLVRAASLSSPTCSVYLKVETELPTGTFKVRGALWALAANARNGSITEVVTSSTGNHGAAVAYAAKLLGVSATIVLPIGANPQKRAVIAKFGARILEHGSDLSEASAYAREYAERSGAFLLNDAGDPDLPAGPATIACEILDELPQPDAIYVPVGDTALIRGIAGAVSELSPQTKLIGVQAANAPAYYRSWVAGTSIQTDTCDTIADGLATRTPLDANVRAIRELVSEMRLVSEDEMLRAIQHLLLYEHIVAEPAGAATTAAFLQEQPREARNIVLVVSGANISAEVLQRAACSQTR
jgi:threonine dehydratase